MKSATGLGPLLRASRILFLQKNDNSWAKSKEHQVMTSYIQPLLLWGGVVLICRVLEPFILHSSTKPSCQATASEFCSFIVYSFGICILLIEGGLSTPAALSVVTQSTRQLLTEQAVECLTVEENHDRVASSSRPDGSSSPPSQKRQKIADMDLFSLIRAPNPTKVKTRSRPHAAHEVPLLTMTANRVIEMEDPVAATDSSGNRGPRGAPPKDVPTTRGAPEVGPVERVAATDPFAVKESRKRGHDGVDANAPPKVLRKDHADPRPTGSTRGGKSLAAIEPGMRSTRPAPVPESAPVDMSDPDPLLFADPRPRLPKALLRQEIRSLRMPPLLSWSGLLRVYTDLSRV
nr:mechanosensitive ion channel protein 3, chloroplastic-like isoform X1 [Tanacetum cinerariifolium]